jgi:hypothetical protein
MLEYVFFNAEPCVRFCAFLREHGIEPTLAEGDPELLVQVDEDRVGDDLADMIEGYYDQMFALERDIHDDQQGRDDYGYEGSGVVVNLKDGTSAYADVPRPLLNKVMHALTLAELSDFVNAIVEAVENPDPRSLCQRARERAAKGG